METLCPSRSALIIDGSYATIGARELGGKIDYIKLRAVLEEQASTQFGDCWFFDQNPSTQRVNPALTAEYHMLKFAPPDGPQFQVSLFPMKKYSCHCKRCGFHFTQNVQKGVDNGIATKILSLAYENICDRFILFAGDGDFYSSLSLVRNVLRKDIWVIGYRGTVSGDLQQLTSRVLWINDLWSQVKRSRPKLSDEQACKKTGQRDQRQKNEEQKDENLWIEDREGGEYDISPDMCSLSNEIEEVDSSRQVVIAPLDDEMSKHSARERSRGRHSGKSRGRNGRGRSRSRSRERLRPKLSGSAIAAVPNARSDVVASTTRASAGEAKKRKNGAIEGKQIAVVRNDKKRKRNGVNKSELEQAKREKRGGEQTNIVPAFALSDISSDEDCEKKPLSMSMPVPLRPVASLKPAQDRDARAKDSSLWSAIINLASETESD